MNSILCDGTSFVFTNSLLQGEAKPAAINIFNLSGIVESIVLHENLKVVNSAPLESDKSKQVRAALLGIPEDIISVMDINYFDMMEKQLIQLEPGYLEKKDAGTLYDYSSRYKNSRSVDKVTNPVLCRFDSSTYQLEKDVLKQVYEHYFDKRPVPPPASAAPNVRAFAGLKWYDIFRPRKAFSKVFDNVVFPNGLQLNWGGSEDKSFLSPYRDGKDILDEYSRMYRLGDSTGGSSFASWRISAYSRYGKFEESILLRAGFYIAASEATGIPYKADFLRSPIIWKYFGLGEQKQLSIEENIFKLASQNEDKRRGLLTSFIKDQSLISMTPLILRAVLKEAKNKDDIIRVALEMRDTNSAKKFRAACSRLNEQIENEEFEHALKEIKWALSQLSTDISSPPSEAVYTLLSIPSESIKGFSSPTFGAALSAEKLVKGGFQLYNWWQSRKYSFVSKVIDQARKAKSLNTEIKRLFAHDIPEDEILLLDRMEKMTISAQ